MPKEQLDASNAESRFSIVGRSVDIWIVYGDQDFNGGFSEVFYTQEEAFARIAELLEIESFDGIWSDAATTAYESGKWKCLECDEHTIKVTIDFRIEE